VTFVSYFASVGRGRVGSEKKKKRKGNAHALAGIVARASLVFFIIRPSMYLEPGRKGGKKKFARRMTAGATLGFRLCGLGLAPAEKKTGSGRVASRSEGMNLPTGQRKRREGKTPYPCRWGALDQVVRRCCWYSGRGGKKKIPWRLTSSRRSRRPWSPRTSAEKRERAVTTLHRGLVARKGGEKKRRQRRRTYWPPLPRLAEPGR